MRPPGPNCWRRSRQQREKLLSGELAAGLLEQQRQFAEDAGEVGEGFDAAALAGGHDTEVERSGAQGIHLLRAVQNGGGGRAKMVALGR